MEGSEVLARFVAWVATLSSIRKAELVRTKAVFENIELYEKNNPGDAAFIAVVKRKQIPKET